jgi:cytosine/uracil/thiamine/allantoin permease
MEVGNIFIRIFLTFYMFYIFSFFSRKKRTDIQDKNKKMDKLRSIPLKSVKQQKDFLDLKYPKRKKFKFEWMMIVKFVFKIIIFIGVFQLFKYVFGFFNIHFAIWQAILVLIIGSLIINYFLRKFNLQKDDISVFFRGGNK